MWIKYASLTLALLLLSGCSLFATKPKLQDGAVDYSKPIPSALTEAYNQGLELMQKEQYPEAEQHWQSTASQWPQFPGVWSNLALAQWHLEQYDEGLASTEKALELNKNFCPGIKVHALLVKEKGLFKEALADYQTAALCAPKDADIPYNMGIIYDLYLQDLSQALTHYTRAQELLTEEDANLTMWIADIQNRQPTRIAGEAE